MKTGTPAEKRLARYYKEHPEDISFETAASVADRLDLSPMTVGRFLRGTGIDAHALPPVRLPVTHPEASISLSGVGEPQRDFDHLRDQADLVRQVGSLRSQPAWQTLVDDLSRAADIHIVAGGASRPLAALFAWRLSEIRSGIHHLDGRDGVFMEILGSRRNDSLLVALDDRSGQPVLDRLCRAARKAGHRVVCLTYCDRPELSEMTDLVVQLPAAQRGTGMDPLGMAALVELVVNAVAAIRGAEASERAGRMAELQAYFALRDDGPG